jgi:hypothetical protein
VHLKNNVNSTAQQLLTSITQPVSMVTANGQSLESTIDMKALGGGQVRDHQCLTNLEVCSSQGCTYEGVKSKLTPF